LKSHIKAWQYVHSNCLINAIVFEDDAIVNSTSPFDLSFFEVNCSVKFFGGFEGLRGANLKIWSKTNFNFIYKCDDFSFLHRMSSYSLDSVSSFNYVSKMIELGIVNDDYNTMFKEGIIKSVFLLKKYEHPPISAPSHILSRKENKSKFIFFLKKIIFNILNFSKYTYNEIKRQ
jgi:GR25 family glycosyltransferase involved in LPS biosynthesis